MEVSFLHNSHMFLMPDSRVHHLNIQNFDSCDVICGTEVLYRMGQ